MMGHDRITSHERRSEAPDCNELTADNSVMLNILTTKQGGGGQGQFQQKRKSTQMSNNKAPP